METVVFVVGAVMVLGGALGVVLRTKPVHCALSLVLTLFGIAVLFIAQDANFLAAVQVIVYAGAIVVLFLFVIMLLGVDRTEDLEFDELRGQRPIAAALGVAALGLIVMAVFAAGGRRVTGQKSRERRARTGEPDINVARQVALLRLRVRLRAHLAAAGHRRARHRDAGPPADHATCRIDGGEQPVRGRRR